MSETWTVGGRTIMPAGDNPLNNPHFGYTETELDLPNDRMATYYGVDVGSCVHAVVLDDDLTTYLVSQYRPNLLVGAINIYVPKTLELPGGFATLGQPVETSILSEIAQEVGKQVLRLESVGTLYTAPGISNERDYIFLARELVNIERPDSGEATEAGMEVVAMPFGEAYDTMRSGIRPVTAQTLAAMSLVAARL